MSTEARNHHGIPLWRVEPSEAFQYRKLFLAIIVRAVLDAVDDKRSAKDDRTDAIAWFQDKGEEFQRTAMYAGFDPDWLSERVLAWVKRRAKGDYGRPAAPLSASTSPRSESVTA